MQQRLPNLAFCAFLAVLVISSSSILSGCKSAPHSAAQSSDSLSQTDTTDAENPYPANIDDFPFEETEGDMPAGEDESARFELTSQFCEEWNPEFLYRKRQCCTKTSGRGKRRPRACAPSRRRNNLCSEATEAQRRFTGEDIERLNAYYEKHGRIPEFGSPQAICTADSGFLSHGIPLIPTFDNRVRLNNPHRCANFGTTGMVLALHRLGRAIEKRFGKDPAFDGVRLIVGDIAAPRGGCLSTRRGSHSGHTNGLDADVAFLHAKANHESPLIFQKKMNAELNWWLLKTLAKESPVCLRYVFLDRSHIKAIRKVAMAAGDPEWAQYSKIMQHISGHRNHFHFRVGLLPKQGDQFVCPKGSQPKLPTVVPSTDAPPAPTPTSSATPGA